MKLGAAIGTALACALGAELALATGQPLLTYQPPLIKLVDFAGHATAEDVTVEQNGRYAVLVRNLTTGVAIDPEGDPGCGSTGGNAVTCPVAGVERIVVRLGLEDDDLVLDLGRFANRIRQRGLGGDGLDELTGAAGAQRLSGGEDADTLRGGPGPDFLNGGPGEDTCIGGPGRDVVRNCE